MAEDAPATAAGTVAPEADERRYLLALFWDAALGFWRRDAGPIAWVLTLGVVALAFVGLGLQFRLNVWYRAMFDAVEQRDAAAVLHLSSSKARPRVSPGGRAPGA